MSLNSPSNHSEQPAPKSKIKRAVLFTAGVGALAAAVLAGKGDTKTTENRGEGTGDCFALATQNPENFKVKNCTPAKVNAEVVGPTTIQIKDKVIRIMNVIGGKGNLTFTQPNFLEMSTGMEYDVVENGKEPGIISEQEGDMLGIPQGTTFYKDLKTGKISTDPQDLK